MFVLSRQLQFFAQVCGVFVPIEPRLIEGNFKQNCTGCAKKYRSEVVAINDRGHLITRSQQLAADFNLCGTIIDGKSNVMHRACTLIGARNFWAFFDVDDIYGITIVDYVPAHVAHPVDFLVTRELRQFVGGCIILQSGSY